MKKYAASGLAIAVTSLVNTSPVLAQAAPQTSVSEGDIIVTAQRRDESLSKTPVAVTVVGSEDLAKRSITTESDLPFAAPGLQVRVGANSNEINFAIRGQSVDQFSGTRPGVLPYFNEVQISSNTGGGGATTSFYDLQSVQVLKGPQGTLFGRNATGGAVLFTTAKPVEGTHGYASARIGDYNSRQLEGALNVGGDTAKARIAGFYSNQDGYQYNLFDKSRPGTLERYGVRGSLTLERGPVRNESVLDYYRAQGSNTQSVLYAIDPNIGIPIGTFYSTAIDGIFGAPGYFASYVAYRNNPQVTTGGLNAFLNVQRARGPFTIATDSTNVYYAKNLIFTNATTLEIGADTKIKNIFGVAKLDANVYGDSDGSPFTIAGADPNRNRGRTGSFTTTNILSDELQLLGKAFDGRLDYVAGVYYAREQSNVFRQSTFTDIFGSADGQLLGATTTNINTTTNKTYAAFSQGTYHLSTPGGSNDISLTAGARYTKEDILLQVLPGDAAFPTPAQLASGLFINPEEKSVKNLSWTLGVQDQVNSNLLLYVASRRSYRNGGFNGNQAPRAGNSSVLGNNFATETATDIEGGLKYSGRLGTVPTHLNLAVYNLWIDQGQRNAFAFVAGNPSSLTVNVPKTQIYGFELDGQAKVIDWLSIGGNVNYTHVEFTNGVTNVNGSPVTFTTVPDTPEWAGAAYADAAIPISGNLKALLRTDLYAQTGTFYISTGVANPSAHLPGYTTVNFRAGIGNDKAGWSLTASVKNALNRTYYVGGIGIAGLLGYNVALPGAPRTFQVEARFKF